MKRFLCFLMVACFAPTFLQAKPLVSGQTYVGNTKLDIAEAGVSFVLPARWMGGSPEGSDFFAMKSKTHTGVILVGAKKLTVSSARQLMSANLPLDTGVVLSLTGKVKVSGNHLSANYTVVNRQRLLRTNN